MTLEFRIDFGYQYLYSRKHYHPTFIWDGGLTVTDGRILKVYKLDYPYIWFGPGHSPKETELPCANWEFKTKREFTGIKIIAEVTENTLFHLSTASFDKTFSAKDIINEGRLDFSVGPKYLDASVIVTKKGYLWFRTPLKDGECEFSANELSAATHDFARMTLAFLNPGESAKWEYEVKDIDKDYSETLLHTVAMAAQPYDGVTEKQISTYIPLELYCDGVKVASYERYYRFHDKFMQMLEDDWVRIQVSPGKHSFELKNCHSESCFAISRITMKECGYNHCELSIPSWALLGECVFGKVFATHADKVTIEGIGLTLELTPGWNEFPICINDAGLITLSTGSHSRTIEIFDCKEEKYPVKVGYDMTAVPHDDTGYMDNLLDYTVRTRLGNYVVFRNFGEPASYHTWTRFGEFCRRHGLYVSSCTESAYAPLVASSKEAFTECGRHEFSGIIYAKNPMEDKKSETMKEATEKVIEYYKKKVDEIHRVSPRAAFGDASGAIRHSFLAGVDFVRAETMVGHTMTLLSQTRAAAEALGEGRWGAHIAIQHHHQPYHENHLGQYFLSLMQPWVMGAETIYEEDSLFNLIKEERQTWDDLLTGGKRDMTRSFFKFAKTHPRHGKNKRNIAYLEGRYAAPFNGFICDTEQDPHYSVWGAFGNDDKSWGHAQPEKARRLLDVLMPGANTHPFRQKFDKRRFYFSGTPCGDFDCTPIEASVDYLKNYKLILNLGWNTAIDEDLEKLSDYVRSGGILLTGLPQFSTHVRREFLSDMKELSLVSNDVLENMLGIRVNGIGEKYSGYWNASNMDKMIKPELSSLPSDDITEDGEARLADVTLSGAEIVAWDYYTGKPMLVKHSLGKGTVYTFTLWAYPGHESFGDFCAAWIRKLSDSVNTEISLTDPSSEVFYSVWEEEDGKKIMLLNTDWTVKGNEKKVILKISSSEIPLVIKERVLTVVNYKNGDVEVLEYSL